MENKNFKNNFGYIEGFYGKLLSWNERKRIIKQLSKNKMNTYLYAPKEDIKHRLNWKVPYDNEWRKKFRDFTSYSKSKNIKIIAGIAPGLSFNYNCLNTNLSIEMKSDFILLFNKASQLLEDGATNIALLLDDIPDNFDKTSGAKLSEGTSHGVLANNLSEKLGKYIYFVPRIYADELIQDNLNYLIDLSIILHKHIKIFYCGENIISKNLTNYSKVFKILPNKFVYWDNYYANDYCPRRLFVGPYVGRAGLKNVMINPTGLIKTDLLILDIVANTIDKKNPHETWKKTLINHGVPSIFNKIKKFFLKPDFGSNPLLISCNIKKSHFKVLEFLLWSWKSDLSREWYYYLFGLKHDLQLNEKILTSERLIKTQTLPLAELINKSTLKGELK